MKRRGTLVLSNAVSRAVTAAGARSTSAPDYQRTFEVKPLADALGVGRQLIARFSDAKRQLDFELRAALYDGRDAVVLETICRNVSRSPITLQCLEPLRAVAEESAACFWPGTTRILTNGQMYYDAGRLSEAKAGENIRSWWDVALHAGEKSDGLVIGYLENKSSLGRITAGLGKAESGIARGDRFSLVAESAYGRGFVLEPGSSVSSDRLVLYFAPTTFTALESYAQAIGEVHRAKPNPPINGWCSWFSFFGAITEAEVLRQAEFAARQLKPFGCEYMQVDDGFYRAFGDWEGNDRFPHGMRWLAEQIRRLGLKPGIWLAPYVITEGTDIHRNHAEWLVHHPDGRLRQIAPGLVEGPKEPQRQTPKLYALDISHPGAADWLHKLFDTVANDWGYDFIKVDFVEWSLLAAERYFDPTVTKAALYRRGAEIMRRAMGPHRHLLDCGPGPVTVGLLDSMRIELDQPPVTWQQYFLHPASTAPAAAKRYYFHNRTWINDADHVVLANLTMLQAQAAATIVGLSGGNMISGDRMSDLDATRLEILKKVFPSCGEAARPIDLFERDRPEVFALRVRRKFGEWLVLGIFNGDEQSPVEKTIALDRLGLDSGKTYVAFDFWRQKFFGEIRGQFTARLEPASVTLLAIHERSGVPQLIATDRHISQGGLELESVTWDTATATLGGMSLGPANTKHNVYLYLPEQHPWAQGDPFMFYDFPGYTLKVTEEHIMRVHVRLGPGGRVPWSINFKEFFAR
ncbi:MAG TPA: alpha-galactosidase [Candidatus Paceibacterota bacterium]|nr:alpha-galactosidase [Verrucomicrobiota bacterium]HSA11982.1 alpha-galactosidase [Candidatus Paceibacterota bacterium]